MIKRKIRFSYLNGRATLFTMLIASSVFVGCGGRPKHVLSESEMIDLLVDMQLAECYSDNEFMGSDRSEKREELAQAILAYHSVTQEELDSSYSWYGRNLDDYASLYEKVDKELQNRKKNLSQQTEHNGQGEVTGSLWPWADHGNISSLGYSDGWVISINDPGLDSGDRIEWRMHLNGSPNLIGMLGIEYSDGSVDNVMSTFMGRDKLEMKLQTDTAKTVTRLFGTLRVREETQLPVFVDSIRLIRLSYDSTEYLRRMNNRRYSPPRRRIIKKNEFNGDTLIIDSIPTNERKLLNGDESMGIEIKRPVRPKK